MVKEIVISILFACLFLTCGQQAESNEVLFVCTHGAARSPIASAYFNKLAKENDLNFHAVFRGTEPDKLLTKETIEGLTKDGFDISNWKPQKVSAKDVEQAYKVVTFDCSVPSKDAINLKEEWNGTPSISKDYTIARNAIKKNVEQLIESLRKE